MLIANLRTQRFSSAMLRHLMLISLLCPFFTSRVSSDYAPDFILSNVFASLFVVSIIIQRGADWKNNKVFLSLSVLLLLGFNAAALHANLMAHHWYMGQMNVTIPFAFFLSMLCRTKQPDFERSDRDFLLYAIILSTLIGIIPFFFGYLGFSAMNTMLQFKTNPFNESQYAWVYAHKSEYALMLVLFLALIVTHRHRFPKRWMYIVSVGIMIACLVISNTRTSMVASVFIFIGNLLETIRKQPSKKRFKYLLLFIPIGLLLAVALFFISQKRDLLSLGSRTYIWSGAVQFIKENPLGLGQQCGLVPFAISQWPYNVYNSHNVFLNFLQQFSTPAGLCCIALIGAIIFMSIKKRFNFLTLGIWAAILIPMNMDWCLLLPQLSMFMVCLYYLFFCPCDKPIKKAHTNTEEETT